MSSGQLPGPVGFGIVGAGFVSDFYLRALRNVRHQRVVAITGRTLSKAERLVSEYGEGVAVASVEELVNRVDVDVVVVAVPQDAHLGVVRAAAAAGKAVICTKPLGRDSAEAAQCLRAVLDAGVWHGYAETAVFSPAIVKAKAIVEAGGIGRVLTVRAREAHASPHPHARTADRMGGGPLRGLGCHGVAVGRFFLDGAKPVEAWAWGDRLDRDDVSVEDNALMMVRFDDGRIAQVEASWTHVAGLDVRREIHGSKGWLGADETGSGLRAFTGNSAGYVGEKAGSDTGWISPVLDEPMAYGYHGEFDHFVECFRAQIAPRQTFLDGVIDAAVVDAGYRSMASRNWETIVIPEGIQ